MWNYSRFKIRAGGRERYISRQGSPWWECGFFSRCQIRTGGRERDIYTQVQLGANVELVWGGGRQRSSSVAAAYLLKRESNS